MPNRSLDSSRQGHSSIASSCSLQQQLHSWRPFQLQLLHSSSSPTKPKPKPKPTQPLDSSDSTTKPPYSCSNATNGDHNHHLRLHPKRPCLSDRATPTSFPVVVDSLDLDMSRLSLMDDDRPVSAHNYKRDGGILRWIARKRRRCGSRSISGRSSDRSGTRPLCCSASAAYGTCSDFPVAAGTDSSGELFLNGDANWASDVSEAARNCRKDRDSAGGIGEKENSIAGFGHVGNVDSQGNESGYGSEPGYRGDGELGYDDEVDEEEDDPRLLFWGDQFGDTDSNMEMVGENTLQKAHHRCRRKKHDLRMVNPLR